jgi:hypothetical protein
LEQQEKASFINGNGKVWLTVINLQPSVKALKQCENAVTWFVNLTVNLDYNIGFEITVVGK